MTITQDQFESTTFILEHQWLLNTYTVPNYRELASSNNQLRDRVRLLTPDHWLSKWMVDNVCYEVRRFDCLHHPVFVDSDPIPEIFPSHSLSYLGFVVDPYKVTPLPGMTDPYNLTKLYDSKFGPGTPQSFLCEHVIVGWVMYYDFGDWAWIAEIQANNTLSGGLLSRPSNRRHFYRHLLSVAMMHLDKPCALLAADDMLSLHQHIRAGLPMPPKVPYRSDIVQWCGMTRSTVSSLPTTVTSPHLTPDMKIWQTFPLA